MKREATCACGQMTVICTGAPELVSRCHCLACQRQTGSAFGVGAFFAREAVEVTGEYKDFKRASDSGSSVRFHFCGTCGSTVFWEPTRMPDWIGVAVGAFGDPAFPGPDQEVHTDTRHGWVASL